MSIIIFLIGLLIGFIVAVIAIPLKLVGSLRVDHSDPTEPPYLFLELSESVESISKRKAVILKVKIEDFIPHK